MSYIEACKAAVEYFDKHLGTKGLTTATEDEQQWFFSSGKDPSNMVGNVVISVSKISGKIEMVDLLSDEGYEMLKKSTKIQIPNEYIGL